MPVATETVAASPVADQTVLTATIRSRGAVDIRPEVSGYLVSIAAKSGQRVEAGQELMQIDPARQRATVSQSRALTAGASAELARSKANLAQLEASLEQGQADLTFAKRQADRVAGLYATQNASRESFDQASAGLKRARAQVDSVKAQIDAQRAAIRALGAQVASTRSSQRRSEVELAYFSVKAPVTGLLADIPVREGDRVDPTTFLTSIVGDEGLELYLPVPVRYSSKLAGGLRVEVLDDDRSVLAESALNFVSPRAEEATQTVLAKAMLPTDNPALRVGRFVRARVTWSVAEAPTVPALAVVQVNTQAYVFAVKKEGQAATVEQRPVELGPLHDQRYAITAGLEAGETVVIEGVHLLRDGAPVAPKPEPTTANAPPPATESGRSPATGASATDEPEPSDKPAEGAAQ